MQKKSWEKSTWKGNSSMYRPIRVEEGPVDGLKAWSGVAMDMIFDQEKLTWKGKFLDLSARWNWKIKVIRLEENMI